MDGSQDRVSLDLIIADLHPALDPADQSRVLRHDPFSGRGEDRQDSLRGPPLGMEKCRQPDTQIAVCRFFRFLLLHDYILGADHIVKCEFKQFLLRLQQF